MTETEVEDQCADEKPTAVVVELRNVTFSGRSENSIHLSHANLILREGELVLLRLDRAQKCRDIASMFQGLRQPIQGEVLFEGADWRGRDFDRHYRMRSRIGRVFEDQAWIQNLNVIENVTLASRHHGTAGQSIHGDIARWTQRMDVPLLTNDRPAFVAPVVLQTYQWIRALISKPKLLILERPMNSVPSSRVSTLIDAVNEVRRRGAAVLWFTSNPGDFCDDLKPPRFEYEVCDGKLSETTGGQR